MKILLPEEMDLKPDLPQGVQALSYPSEAGVPAEHQDADALVIWGIPAEHLRQAAERMPNLRWLQTLASGTETLLAAGFSKDLVLTSGRGLHDQTVSEHALALILALLRRLPECGQAQLDLRWAGEIGGIQPLHPAGRITTLVQANVLIWGFGSIGTRLASVLRTLGANVTGVARSVGERHGFPVIDHSRLSAHLAGTDILVMLLPSSPSTDHALSAARLAELPAHAVVINVGRGSTVDETALSQALVQGAIAGAALDVTQTEPLPSSSPLWRTPNLLITPHAAGGRPIGADELITHNLAALTGGGHMRNLVEHS